MDHMAKLLEGMHIKFEDDELDMDDDEFDFDLDNKSDDVDPDMDHDDDELDLDIGDDDEEVGDTEERLNDLEDKVTDILNKLSQIIAQDMTDDEMGGDDDMGDEDELDLDVDADDEELDDKSGDTDDGLRGDDVKEYEDNLPAAGDPDDDDYEADGDFDISTYGSRGAKKARRFKQRWGKHRADEDAEHDDHMRSVWKVLKPIADKDDDQYYNTLRTGIELARKARSIPSNAIAEVMSDLIGGPIEMPDMDKELPPLKLDK